jgi:hypothetical protein
MIKKVLLGIFIVLAIFFTATFLYWTQQPAYTLSKLISAARLGDTQSIEKLIDLEGVTNSVIEEMMLISQQKFPMVGALDTASSKAQEFFKGMVKSYLRDVLNSEAPGFKFKELSTVTYLLLQTKLYLDFFGQKVIVHSDEVVDVSYDLKDLFALNYFAVFTYKKIGEEWVLFEIKQLTPR